MREALFSLLFFSFFLLELFWGSLHLWAFQRLVSSQPMSLLSLSFRQALVLIFPLVLLFLILNFATTSLFPWVSHSGPGQFRQFYLQPMTFWIRNFIYFAIWLFLGLRIRQEKNPKAPLILILGSLTVTFASIDWIASLNLHFRSSAFGLVIFMSSALLAYGFHLRRLSGPIDSKALVQLNNIHLALIGSWAYVTFMEYLIIWFGNTPQETSWFIPRVLTSWSALGTALILVQFSIPLFLLFFRASKKSLAFTKGLGLVSYYMQAVFLFWLIFPSVFEKGVHLSVSSTLAILLVALSPFLRSRWIP